MWKDPIIAGSTARPILVDMKIRYLDGARLRRALLAACDHARVSRAELNRINVFPVPDGDTGTNLALTVTSVADALRRNHDADVGSVARAAASAGIMGARGNCGMILSHWLIGLSEGLRERSRVNVDDVKRALRNAADHIYGALEQPVEGTMLTVMRETAEEAEACTSGDLAELHERILARARVALARTPELLPVLKRAGVVDAGAKGFVQWLEGIGALIDGDPIAPAEAPVEFGEAEPVASAEFPSGDSSYRFCTEALVRGDALPAEAVIRSVLRDFGDSLIVIQSGELLKVHVHTDDPDGVIGYLRGVGRLESHKAEDMRIQHATARRGGRGVARRPVSIVTDSACDLPEAVIRAHGIHVVPLSLIYEDRVLRDGIDIDADTFMERLRRGEHPGTSQPPPAAFHEAYDRASQDAEEIVVVLIASALSGTLASAQVAAKQAVARAGSSPVHVVDSRAATLCQGLLVMKAAELAERGMPPAEIATELGRVRDRSGIFFTLDTLDRLVASGRVSRGRGWVARVLGIKPILGLDATGAIRPEAKVRGADALLPKVLELLAERMGDSRAFRFGVVHVDAEAVAERVRTALIERFGDRDVLMSPATPVLATHIGRGAWAVAYMVED
jgi:uncharacterized protein